MVFLLAIAITLLAQEAVAQRPPAPAPAPQPPPTTPSGRPSSAPGSSSEPTLPRDDLVMFLRGRIATTDGSPVPSDLLIERVCNNRTRQEVYASPHGDFSMQLGSRTDSFPEASADLTSPYSAAGKDKDSFMGIPRRELKNCELRASGSGFRPSVLSLMDLDPSDSNIDVGVIVVRRGIMIDGTTLSSLPYKAPKNARKAYEKGVQAERNGKLAEARKYLETAVRTYPRSPNAWFQLGTILQKENEEDAARKAYTQATTLDTKFLPPYLSLATMAYRAGNWAEVLNLTDHILCLYPLNPAATPRYILDLYPMSYASAYFYNPIANYKLKKFKHAERPGLQT